MPKHRTVDNTQLQPNKNVIVTGKVTWSRIASFIEGEELDQKNQRRQTNGIMPITTPHTSFSIEEAQVQPESKNPDVLTDEETYIKESFFQSVNNSNPNARSYNGMRYSIDNRGNRLPAVFRRGDADKGENPSEFYQVYPKYEIANGSKVLLVLRSYVGRMSRRAGFSLDAIIILDKKAAYATPNRGTNARVADYMKQRFGFTLHTEEPEGAAETEYTGADAVAAAAQTVANPGIKANDTAYEQPNMPAEPAPAMPMMDDEDVTVGITVDNLMFDD